MKMPSYVNPEALLSDEEVSEIVQNHPSLVRRGKLIGHVAVTNAVIKEMALVAEKEREHIAAWLDDQGGVYARVAKAIREGTTPDLDQPVQQPVGETLRPGSEDLVSLEVACRWLEDKFAGETVRAKAIQKAARLLREDGLRSS